MNVRNRITWALLACGALSAAVYLAADVLAAAQWEGYRIADRALSELMAVGSPTRDFILPWMTAYNVLILAFGVGVWRTAGDRRSLRATGALIAVYGVVSWMGLVLFPLQPDSGLTATGALPLSGVLHTGATLALVLLMLAFVGVGAAALGRGFRIYSVLTLVLVLVGGAWAGTQLERVAAGLPTPGFGIIERTNIYASVIWVAVLAVMLLKRERAFLERLRARGGSPSRVTVFVGSPQKRGATRSAAEIFASQLEALGGVVTEVVQLSDYHIGVCRGCKVCMDRGEDYCPLKDDRDVLLAKIASSDGIVLAAPNYTFQAAATTKIFLDRLGYLFHRPRFHGKVSSAIVVQGIYRGRAVRKYLEFVGGALGCNVARGSVIRTLKPMTEAALRRQDRLLAAQARRYHERLMLDPYPAPGLFPLMMFRMGRTAMYRSGREETVDHAYYAERGWFESDYFYPTRLGPFKKAFGAFVDWTVARIPAFQVDHAEKGGRGSATPVTP